MKINLLLTSLLILPLVAGPAFADDPQPIDFHRDIAPILARNCIACHNAKKAEGGLNLESHTAVMAGGDSGPSIVAGTVEESYLIDRILSDDDPMPPDGNSVGAERLTSEQVDLLRQWITQGAAAPSESPGPQMTWQPVPEGLQPVYAIAASPDGNHLSFGRGSTVTVTRQVAGEGEDRIVEPLIDPQIQQSFGSDDAAPPATHLDIVQSMAFSPDSQRLATGGYRTVKIWHRQTDPIQTLSGISLPTGLTVISPDGRRIAQSFGDHVLEVTDRETGQSRRYLTTHSAEVTALVWLADSPRLISCDASGHIALTDLDSDQTQSFPTQNALVCKSLVRIDDSRLLVIDDQGQLHLATLEIGETPESLSFATIPLEGFVSVAFAAVTQPEANQAVVASADGRLKVVSLPGMAEGGVQVLREIDAQQPIRGLAISSGGRSIAVLPEAGPVHLWNVETGELRAKLDRDELQQRQIQIAARDVARQQAFVEGLAAKVPELKTAAEQETEATKKVQETRDKAAEALEAKVKLAAEAAQQVTEAEQALAAAQAELEAANEEAAEGAKQQVEAKQADLEAKQKALAERETEKTAAEAELAKGDQALATAKDGAARAAAKVPELEQRIAGETTHLATLQARQEEVQATEVAATDRPLAMAFSSAGGRLAVTHADGRLRVFDSRTGKLETQTATAANLVSIGTTPSEQLVGLSETGVLQTWDLRFPWELERTIGGLEDSPFSDRITALNFSPSGELLAVGSGPPSRYGDIKLIDVETGEVAQDLGEAHSDTVLSLQFSPDGRYLASGGADKLCRVFDIATGELHRALEGHTHHVLGVAWKDDGQTLITASSDKSIKVWDVENSTQRRTIGGFGKEVAAVRFVGETSEFVLASADGTARLYNADNGQQVRPFAGAANALYAISVSVEQGQVYAGGQTGQVWTWKLDDAQLLQTLP